MEKENTIRILKSVLKELKMTPRELAIRIRMHKQSVYDVLNVNKKNVGISKNLATKIIEHFPQFNPSFLLTGEGDMLSTGQIENSQEESTVKLIPLLPISAEGGSLRHFYDAIMLKDCKMIPSHVDDAHFAMFVTGDSMEPEYPAGSMIFIKRVNEKSFIEWGRAYVLDTCNGSVIKQLMPADDGSKDKIKCVSINPKYPSFEVPFADIYGIYRIRACTSLK